MTYQEEMMKEAVAAMERIDRVPASLRNTVIQTAADRYRMAGRPDTARILESLIAQGGDR